MVRINGEKLFALQFLQARNPEWVRKPFYARFDDKATWMDELVPAFGQKKFFFESEDSEPMQPPARVIPINPVHGRDPQAGSHQPDAA